MVLNAQVWRLQVFPRLKLLLLAMDGDLTHKPFINRENHQVWSY